MRQTLYPVKDTSVAYHTHGYPMYQSGASNLWIGNWDHPDDPRKAYAGSYMYDGRMLIQFPNISVPAGSIIGKATLRLYLMDMGGMSSFNAPYDNYTKNRTLQVSMIQSHWEEGTGDGFGNNDYSGCNYYYRAKRSSSRWYSWNYQPGDPYDNSSYKSTVTQNVDNNVWEFDVKNIVNGWISGGFTNNGLLIKHETMGLYGGLWSYSKEDLTSDEKWNKKYIPQLIIEYSTPPEAPKGLSPASNSIVSPQIPDSMIFKWNFIDYASKLSSGTKADIAFLIDVSGSNRSSRGYIESNISTYLRKLEEKGINYQAWINTYSDVGIGESLDRIGSLTNERQLSSVFSRIDWKYGGDYKESGLESIHDAMDLPFRPGAKVHFVVIGDAPFHAKDGDGESIYGITETANALVAREIVLTNVNRPGVDEIAQLHNRTGGGFHDIGGQWGHLIQIFTGVDSGGAMYEEEEDYQTRADIRLYNASGSYLASFTVSGSNTFYDMSSAYPFQNGQTYQWDVLVYDSIGLTSPVTEKKSFRYKVLTPAESIPSFSAPIKVGQTISREALDEIKTQLLKEAKKYQGYGYSKINRLFTGEVVPSTQDYDLLMEVLRELSNMEGIEAPPRDIVGDTLGVTDIEKIRLILQTLAKKGPSKPNIVGQPTIIQANIGNIPWISSNYSGSIYVQWGEPTIAKGEFRITLPSNTNMTKDAFYYKIFYTQYIKVKDPTGNNTNRAIEAALYYLPSDFDGYSQIGFALEVFSSHTMTYRAYDYNGNKSDAVIIDLSSVGSASSIRVPRILYYESDGTHRHGNRTGEAGSIQNYGYRIHAAPGTVAVYYPNCWRYTYWYRVRWIDENGNAGPWTYTNGGMYIT